MDADRLIADLRAKLIADPRTRVEIAEGSGVSTRWLYMFASGEIDNPTIRQLESLADFLNADPARRGKPASRH